MKRKQQFLLSLFLLTLGIFSCSSTVYAKAWMVKLKANTTYKTDVTGDGKKDTLKFTEKNIQSDYPSQTHRIFYINGKKVKDIASYGSAPIYFYKNGTSNEYLIVGSHYKGGSNDYSVFHCKKSLKNIGYLPTDYFVGGLYLTGNNIKYITYAKGMYVTKYRPIAKLSNGCISLAGSYPKITGRTTATANQSQRTRKSVNSKNLDGFKLYKGQKVKILKVYLKKSYNSYFKQYFYEPYYYIRVNNNYGWITYL